MVMFMFAFMFGVVVGMVFGDVLTASLGSIKEYFNGLRDGWRAKKATEVNLNQT